MEFVSHLELLKEYIVDLDFIPCDNSSGILMKRFSIPKDYYRDLKKVCKAYEAKFKIIKNPNPYYRQSTKTVCLNYTDEYRVISSFKICRSFCHELAHRVQHIVYDHFPDFNKLSDDLAYEREAERLAYFLYKKYFTHLWRDLPHQNFCSYRSKRDVKFLYNYYKSSGLENDLKHKYGEL